MFTVVIPICSLLFSLIVETGKFSASKEVRINYTMLTLILLQITTGGYVLLVCTYYYSSFATDIITAMLDDHCKRIVITFILPVIQHGHQSLCHFNLSGMAANHLLVYIIKYTSFNDHAQKLTIMYVILMSGQDDPFFQTLHPWIGISHPNHESRAK